LIKNSDALYSCPAIETEFEQAQVGMSQVLVDGSGRKWPVEAETARAVSGTVIQVAEGQHDPSRGPVLPACIAWQRADTTSAGLGPSSVDGLLVRASAAFDLLGSGVAAVACVVRVASSPDLGRQPRPCLVRRELCREWTRLACRLGSRTWCWPFQAERERAERQPRGAELGRAVVLLWHRASHVTAVSAVEDPITSRSVDISDECGDSVVLSWRHGQRDDASTAQPACPARSPCLLGQHIWQIRPHRSSSPGSPRPVRTPSRPRWHTTGRWACTTRCERPESPLRAACVAQCTSTTSSPIAWYATENGHEW